MHSFKTQSQAWPKKKLCDRCRGTGWASAARDSGTENAPPMFQQIGVYRCDDCKGTGITEVNIELFEAFFGAAERSAMRRIRICKQAPLCPSCRSRQVQLVSSNRLARWKCRQCKAEWIYEPLVCKLSSEVSIR